MAISVAELTAVLRAEVAPFVKGMADSEKSLAALRKQVSTTSGALTSEISAASAAATKGLGDMGGRVSSLSGLLSQAGLNTGAFGQAAGALTGPLGLAGAAVVGLGLAVKSVTDFMGKNYDQMRGLMAVSGLEADAADQLADTFDLLGFNVEALRGAMFKMSAEVDNGGKGLRELGISLRNASGEVKAEGAIFLEVRDRISEMGSASERNAAAMKFFGRSAREMAEVFAMSSKEFNTWLETAGKMGPSAEESLRVTREYTRAAAQLSKEWQGFVEVVGQHLLPVLTQLIGGMNTLINLKPPPWLIWVNNLLNPIAAANAAITKLRETFAGAQQDMAEMASAGAAGMLGGREGGKGLVLTQAEVEDEKRRIKEREAELLRSLDLVQARELAALKVSGAAESEAAALSARLANQRFAAKAEAIDAEIAAIRKTSTAEIKDGTDASDKIKALLSQRADAYTQMQVAAVSALGTIKAAEEALLKAADAKIFEATYRARLDGIDAQEKADMDLARAESDLADKIRALQRSYELFGDQEARNTEMAQAYTAAINALPPGFSATDERVKELTESLIALNAEVARSRDLATMIAELARTLDEASPQEEREADAWRRINTEWRDAEKMAQALGGAFDLTSVQLNLQWRTIRQLIDEGWDPLGEKVQAAVNELNRLQDVDYADRLATIGIQAQLAGSRFDGAGAQIALMSGELNRLLRESQNTWTPQIQALSDQINHLIDVDKLTTALGLARTVFDDFVTAAGQTAQNMQAGFSEFFFDVFTGQVEKLTDVFKAFGLSMLRVLTDFLASQTVKLFLNFLADLIGGFSGGGGGLLGGLVGALAKALQSMTGGGGGGGGGINTGDLVGIGTKVVDWLGGLFGPASPVAQDTATLGYNFLRASDSVTSVTSSMGDLLGVIGGVVGLGTSIYGLAASIKSGSGLGIGTSLVGTGLSAYSLAGSFGLVTPLTTLITEAFTAAFPEIAAAVAEAVGVGVETGLGAAAGAGSLGIGIGIAATGFGQLLMGGLAGMAQDQATYVQWLRETAGMLRSAASAVQATTALFEDINAAVAEGRLPDTFSKLQYAVRSLPDLAYAVSIGAESITSIIPEWRAKVGAVLLAALDAAQKLGQDASTITTSALRLSTTTGYASDTAAGQTNLAHLVDLIAQGVNQGRTGATIFGAGVLQETNVLLEHLLQLTGDEGRMLADLLARGMGSDQFFSAESVGDLWARVMTPEHLAALGQSIGDIGNFDIDPDKINRLLDGEFLTIALRNAVVDIGARLGVGVNLGSAGSNWQMGSGSATGTIGGMPSVAEIAEVQRRLTEAGFEPGRYGQALKDFLISIDANVVNNPEWAAFTASLEAGGPAGPDGLDLDAIIRDAFTTVSASPAAFYEGAKGLVDNLKAQIDHQLEVRAGTTDSGTIENIDKVLATMTAQVKAWDTIITLYGTLNTEIAGLTGDLEATTTAAIEAWTLTDARLTGAITDAAKDFDKAIGGGNIVAIADAAQGYHDAVIANFNAQLAAVRTIHEAIDALLDKAKTVSDTVIGAGVTLLDQGDATVFNEVYTALVAMAADAPTVAQRLLGVGQGIAAVLAALPSTTRFLTAGAEVTAAGGGTIPDAILAQVAANVAPFFAALGDMLQGAVSAGDIEGELALLEQQVSLIQEVSAAAIKAVEDWAAAARTATNEAADAMTEDINKNWDAMTDAVNETYDRETTVIKTRLDALAKELELAQRWATVMQASEEFVSGLETAALSLADQADAALARFTAAQAPFAPATYEGMPSDAMTLTPEDLAALVAAAQDYLAAITASINDQIVKLQEWQAAIDGVTNYIDSLALGLLSLSDQTDALKALADAALAAYNLEPTAEGLTKLQEAQKAYLDAFIASANAQIEALKAWQAAIDGVDAAIRSIAASSGLSSLTDQLDRARTAATDAVNAYLVDPSAEGLADLTGAVQDYYNAAMAQENERRDAEIAAAQAVSDARIAGLTAEIDAANEAIDAVQAAAKLEQEAIAVRVEALRTQIALTREWEGAIKTIDEQLTSMQLGAQSPLGREEQLAIASNSFTEAIAAFRQAPTAAAVSGITTAARDLLGAGAGFGTQSAEYRALFDRITAGLKEVRGTAAELAGPVTSADLEAQMQPLQDLSKRIASAAEAQVAALTATVAALQDQIDAERQNALDVIAGITAASDATKAAIAQSVLDTLAAMRDLAPKDITESIERLTQDIRDKTLEIADLLRGALGEAPADIEARILALQAQLQTITADIVGIIREAQAMAPQVTAAQIQAEIDLLTDQLDWWDKWKADELDHIDDRRKLDLDLVLDWKKKQLEVIDEERDKTIAGIQTATAAALRDNSKEQNDLLGRLYGAQLAQLDFITGGQPEQVFMANQAKRAADSLANIERQLGLLVTATVPATGSPPAPSSVDDFGPGEGGLLGAAGGLAYVPRTMPVLVHPGEGILTAEENAAYRNAGPVVPSYSARRRATTTVGAGDMVEVIIPRLTVPVTLNGEKLGEAVIDNLKVRGRRSQKSIPANIIYPVRP